MSCEGYQGKSVFMLPNSDFLLLQASTARPIVIERGLGEQTSSQNCPSHGRKALTQAPDFQNNDRVRSTSYTVTMGRVNKCTEANVHGTRGRSFSTCMVVSRKILHNKLDRLKS